MLQNYINSDKSLKIDFINYLFPTRIIELQIRKSDFIEINQILTEKWPVIDALKERPSDYLEWKEIKDKRQFIEEYLD